eukprot:1320362-Prymnesium_polylepis.1
MIVPAGRSAKRAAGVNMLRETDGTWDNGYTHAWTQVRGCGPQATWDRASQGAPRYCEYIMGNG